jgi:glycosyltransferase involved in cell wall biosynthesis
MERVQGEPVVNAPAVTVVVVNYNGGDYLRGCLASLARQTFTDFETIVIDNASSDDSLARIREQPARTILLRQDRNLGFAAGNNVGARAGRGRWLALLNPDAEASPDWLAAMMRAVEHRPTHRMVACLQISLHEPGKLDGLVMYDAEKQILALSRAPFVVPMLSGTENQKPGFLGFSMVPRQRSVQPVPRELLQQLQQPGLVVYDWEITSENFVHWWINLQNRDLSLGLKPAPGDGLATLWLTDTLA